MAAVRKGWVIIVPKGFLGVRPLSSISKPEVDNPREDADNLPPGEVKTAYQNITKFRRLNAFTFVASESSLKAQLDKVGTTEQGPLKGLPVAVKDNFCVAGMPATCGSKMLSNFLSPYTATVVQKLISAGAVIMGKTNMDEFGMGNGTVDSIYGPCKSPWGVEESLEDFRVPGGSSGGSAVAVATGVCFGALGSDTGGSTRNPASYCGVVGLKPTYGTLSRHGLIPLVNSMDVPGILTLKVDHCALLFDLLKGWDPKDATTVSQAPTYSQNSLPSVSGCVKSLKIGIPQEFHSKDLSPEVASIWQAAADILEQGGAQVEKVSLPHTKYSIVCYSVLNPCEVASNMARYDGLRYGHRALRPPENSTEALYAQTRHEGFNKVVRGRILTGNYFLLKKNYSKYFQQALKVRRLIKQDYDNLWQQGYHCLLTPVTLTAAPKYKDFVKWDNRTQSSVQDYCTQPANMAGIPALSLPVGLSRDDKLPLSVQLMAPRFGEGVMFEVAKFLEAKVNFPHFAWRKNSQPNC